MTTCQHFSTDYAPHPDDAGLSRHGLQAVNAVILASLLAALLLVLCAPVAAHAQAQQSELLRQNPSADERWQQDLRGNAELRQERTDRALRQRMRLVSAWKAQVGQGPRLAGMPGSWHGELQLIRSNGRGPQPYGSNYRRGLWLLNGANLPITPHEGTTLNAYSKVGLHYMAEQSGLGQVASRGGLRLGLGGGMAWQFRPGSQLSIELSRIDRSADVISLGTQLAF